MVHANRQAFAMSCGPAACDHGQVGLGPHRYPIQRLWALRCAACFSAVIRYWRSVTPNLLQPLTHPPRTPSCPWRLPRR